MADDDYHDGPMREMSTNDLFIKDAFLVFRALCKLTMKPLNPERCVSLATLEFSHAKDRPANETSSHMQCAPSCFLCISF